MNPGLVLSNILTYSLQSAALIFAALLLSRLLKLPRPLVFLQLVLATALLLPLLQNWPRPVVKISNATPSRVIVPMTALERVDSAAPIDWAYVGLCFVGVGILARLGWLLLGLTRLRSLLRCAEVVREGLAISSEVAGPVTFGFRRPVILLPPSVLALSPEAQAAIMAHEEAHIRRRDWLYSLSEEFVLCILWFHPAMWILISRIRLAREQVVDFEASRKSASRQVYVEALLAVSEARIQPYVEPAPAFLRRRQLAARIQSLVLEVPMPRFRRIVSYSAATLGTLALAVWTVTAFPMQGAPQSSAVPDNVTVQGAEPIFIGRPAYPFAARAAKVEGPVTLELTLSEYGEVADARVIAGPDELRKAALTAVLNWQFQAGPKTVRVVINFRIPPPTAGQAVTKVFIEESMPGNLAATLRARLKPFEGQPYTDEIQGVIRSVSPTLRVRMEGKTTGGANEVIVFVGPSLAEASVPGRIRVGGAVQAANLINKVEPEYPALARQARIQGSVRFSVTIDRTGAVSGIEVVSGHPLLIPAAQVALSQYRYRVTQLNGEPVEVSTQVDVNFTL